MAALPAGPGGAVTIGFTPGDSGPGGAGRGVYPVEVRLRSADDDTVASLVTYLSFLTAETPEFPPLDVAVLVDVAAEPALQPDGSTTLPPDALDRAGERIQVLQKTADVQLTLAPRPETLEGLVHGGPPAAAAVEQLRELATGVPVFARPFVDVDLAALQRAGLISEANAQADGGANVVRSRLAVEPTGGMWLSGPTLGAEAARLAVDLGIDRAVVPPSAVDDGSDDDDESPPAVPAAPVRLGDDGPLAMVTDSALAAHLTGDDGMVAAHRFVAELAITWLEAPSIPRAVVVHIPPDADIDPDVVAVALGALSDGQAVRAVPVDQIFQEVPPLEDGPTTVSLAPHDVTDDLGSLAPALQSARDRVAGVGAVLGDPGVTTSLEQALLVSTGTDTPDDERAAYVERANVELSSVSGAVTLPDEFRITLTSRSSTIPVTLDQPVRAGPARAGPARQRPTRVPRREGADPGPRARHHQARGAGARPDVGRLHAGRHRDEPRRHDRARHVDVRRALDRHLRGRHRAVDRRLPVPRHLVGQALAQRPALAPPRAGGRDARRRGRVREHGRVGGLAAHRCRRGRRARDTDRATRRCGRRAL